jgi:hypothetical protein
MRDDAPDGHETARSANNIVQSNTGQPGEGTAGPAQEHKTTCGLMADFCDHGQRDPRCMRRKPGGFPGDRDLQIRIKASIMRHVPLPPPAAQAADCRGPGSDSPQGSRLAASQAPPEQDKSPAAGEPLQGLRQVPVRDAAYTGRAPPEKDIKHAAPRSYAELVRGVAPKDPPKRRSSLTTIQDKQSLCQAVRRLSPTVRTPALHCQEGEQRFTEREGGGDGFLCPDRNSANSQIWDYDRRLAELIVSRFFIVAHPARRLGFYLVMSTPRLEPVTCRG